MTDLLSLPRPVVFSRPDGSQDQRTALHQLEDGGYRKSYRFEGGPGSLLLQRVTTEVHYYCGDELRVSYLGSYWEYFRLDVDGSLGMRGDGRGALRDVHDFSVWRDGWNPQQIRGLFRASQADGQRLPVLLSGQPRVECVKRFSLGTGEIMDARPSACESGAQYGFLAQEEPALISLHLDGAEPLRIETSPLPGPGAGRVGAGWEACWECEERFRFDFATLSGVFEDQGGYRSCW